VQGLCEIGGVQGGVDEYSSVPKYRAVQIVIQMWNFRLFSALSMKNILTLRRLMSYIYGAPILEVSRSHTRTQHSR